jgi:hypothetical protein
MKEQVVKWEGSCLNYVGSQGEHSQARRLPSHSSAKCPDC